jgi:hypothetical protein
MNADIVRVSLLDAALDGQPEIGRVRSARIELGAGQEAGRHRHPCDVVGYVAAGTIRFQVEGEEEKTLRAGRRVPRTGRRADRPFRQRRGGRAGHVHRLLLLPPGEDTLIEMLPAG